MRHCAILQQLLCRSFPITEISVPFKNVIEALVGRIVTKHFNIRASENFRTCPSQMSNNLQVSASATFLATDLLRARSANQEGVPQGG
jgi:hypothetical protein